jgi:nucleoid DNA-binding protein
MPLALTGLDSINSEHLSIAGIDGTPTKGLTMDENQATPIKKPMNKTEIVAHLTEATGLTKEQVSGLFDELAKLIDKNLDEQGPGVFAIPNLLQIKVVRKPAVEAHMGINPFTKQEMMLKAKPAQNVVKLVPLKGLKDMVSKKAE